MKNKENFALGLCLISILLIGISLFSGLNNQINVKLDNGNIITTPIPTNYSFLSVILIIIFTSIASISCFYYTNEFGKKINLTKKQQISINMLEGELKGVYLLLLEKGSMLQKDLVFESGLSKVKIHRIIEKLDNKKLIKRVSYGNTNKIELLE